MPPSNSSRRAPRRLRLNLLENGLDFIREGIETLYGAPPGRTPSKNASKYALLHVFAGTLLVLKERLRRAHPSLIFSKVHEALSGGHTVDFGEVQRRLEGAIGVKLTAADKDTLAEVQQQRNRLEHFEADLELNELNQLIGKLVDFLERFMHDELQESLIQHLSPAAAEEVGALKSIAERERQRREAEWQRRIDSYRNLTDEQLRALRAEYEDVYVHPKHGPEAEMFTCDECGAESVAVADGVVGVCTELDCRSLHIVSRCRRCRAEMLGNGGLCGNCQS